MGIKIRQMALAKLQFLKRFKRMSGRALRSIRKPKMTLEQLSEATGISQSQLSRFETEKRKPRVEEAVAIAKALDVQVPDIFPSLAAEAPITDSDIQALLESVRRSYHMLGLDEDAANSLLKLVLERAAMRKAPSATDAARHRQQGVAEPKSDLPKVPEDGET